MSVAPDQHVRLTAVMEYNGGGQIMNVFDVQLLGTTTYSDGDFMEEAELFLSDVYTAGQAMFSTALVPVEIRGFATTANHPLPVTAWTHWGGGTSGGSNYPAGNAVLVLFRTGVNKILGRKFFGGLPIGAATNGKLTSGAIIDAGTIAAEMVVGHDMTSGDGHITYIVQNRFGFPFYPIDVTIRADIAYQRRRKPGVGV